MAYIVAVCSVGGMCVGVFLCCVIQWHCGVVVITTAQLHKPVLGFCAGSNPDCGMSENRQKIPPRPIINSLSVHLLLNFEP